MGDSLEQSPVEESLREALDCSLSARRVPGSRGGSRLPISQPLEKSIIPSPPQLSLHRSADVGVDVFGHFFGYRLSRLTKVTHGFTIQCKAAGERVVDPHGVVPQDKGFAHHRVGGKLRVMHEDPLAQLVAVSKMLEQLGYYVGPLVPVAMNAKNHPRGVVGMAVPRPHVEVREVALADRQLQACIEMIAAKVVEEIGADGVSD
jgi:hypothetical protein